MTFLTIWLCIGLVVAIGFFYLKTGDDTHLDLEDVGIFFLIIALWPVIICLHISELVEDLAWRFKDFHIMVCRFRFRNPFYRKPKSTEE